MLFQKLSKILVNRGHKIISIENPICLLNFDLLTTIELIYMRFVREREREREIVIYLISYSLKIAFT
jgi:hypothetical protein